MDHDWWGNCNTVKSEVQDAMSTYNNLGNNIDLTTTSSHTEKIVYAQNMGIHGLLAEATFPYTSDGYIRFNNIFHWSTSNGCDDINGFNLEWIANHELGHTVGLYHPKTPGENSVMVPNCATSWSDVQSHDKAVLDDKYP